MVLVQKTSGLFTVGLAVSEFLQIRQAIATLIKVDVEVSLKMILTHTLTFHCQVSTGLKKLKATQKNMFHP